MSSDLFFIIKWWIYLLGIGLLFFPLANAIFNKFFDRGYIFSKTLGIVTVSYLAFILGALNILQFSRLSLFLIILFLILLIGFIVKKIGLPKVGKKELVIIAFQELLFLMSLLFWAYIKSFQPDIHGLEKYMDFGFINSILRSEYFPPVDMWFPPLPINYYYFGHLTTAVLIKLTAIPGYIAYNLMLATIFAFTVTSAFSIVSTLTYNVLKIRKTSFVSGIIAGILTSLGGNLHTIYAFFKPYTPPENPVPFWQLQFAPNTFPNSYWYPNATRFIPLTIHEFPSYSFVVSDLHGHVLDIPFVFLTIGLILVLFLKKNISVRLTILVAFMLAVMYMTNAWDGIIYFGLFFLTVLLLKSDILNYTLKKKKDRFFTFFNRIKNKRKYFLEVVKLVLIAGIFYVIFALPFNINFKPFVSGIGVVCPPDFLVAKGNIGPLLFEADHCQRTPFWMLITLYGFFYFFVIALVIKILRLATTPIGIIFTLLLVLVSTLLIATPEFIYAKDIYPAHYRANTMFKLGYQAFIMLSLVTSFSIAYLFHHGRKIFWIPITFILMSLVLLYPYFAVMSYFSNLSSFRGLNGISYLKTLHPDDHDAIYWIQENIKGQPVMAEAQGDSYTDYGRVSANTGLPTPLGWTVHEWLWRGDYSFPQSRLEDVRFLYEGTVEQTKQIIDKYNISYVYVGQLEKTKYPMLNESNFINLAKTIVYKKGGVTIYKMR